MRNEECVSVSNFHASGSHLVFLIFDFRTGSIAVAVGVCRKEDPRGLIFPA